jgi:hypothetical protein
MMTKNVSGVVRPPLVLGVWLLGSLPGQCLCHLEGQGDELFVANADDSKAALRAIGPMARANRLGGPASPKTME